MDYTPLQYIFLYATAVFFSSLAIDRESLIPCLLSSLLWLLSAIFSFILGPSDVGVAFAYSMGLVSVVFLSVFVWRLGNQLLDSQNLKKQRKFETWSPM